MRDLAAGCLSLDTVQSFVDGVLGAEAVDRVEAHLDQCDDCRMLVSALARSAAGPAADDGSAASVSAPSSTVTDPTSAPPWAEDSLLVGVTLGETYKLVRMIGKGGMGVIYEATHERLRGRRCAVKVLSGSMINRPTVLERLRREAEIASRLGNQHIVEAHDFNVADGHAYIVMELLDGEDLSSRLRARGALPVADATSVFLQVASALDAAHGAQVIHRDLKPSNIFLCRRGEGEQVKVLDFGLSKVIDSMTMLTRDHAILGTPPYMSPEQAEGRIRDVDARTDVFALGAVVWEMLSGRRAFGAPSLQEALRKVRFEDPPPVHVLRPELSPRVSDALGRALAKDRDARTPTVAALREELTAALAASPSLHAAVSVSSPGGSAGYLATLSAEPAPLVEEPGREAARPAEPPPHGASSPVAWPAGSELAAPAARHAPPQVDDAHPRGLVLALSAVGLIAIGIWIAVGRSLGGPDGSAADPGATSAAAALPPQEDHPGARAEPARPGSAAVSDAPAASPAGSAADPGTVGAARDRSTSAAGQAPVTLTFAVSPRDAAASIYLDGKQVTGGRARVGRSTASVRVTAVSEGYREFTARVVPDRDRTVAIALHRRRSAGGRRATVKPGAARPTAGRSVAPSRDAVRPTSPSRTSVASGDERTASPPAAAAPPARPALRPTAPTRTRPAPARPKPSPEPTRPGTGTVFDE